MAVGKSEEPSRRHGVSLKVQLRLRLIAAGLAMLGLAGCAASNPNSEVMTDTSANKKQTVIGETQQRVSASQLGEPTVGDE